MPGRRETHLTYVHLHNKSYLMTLEHAKRKLAHFVDVGDRDAVKAYVGPGSHLINHFMLTEEQLLCKYEADQPPLSDPGGILVQRDAQRRG